MPDIKLPKITIPTVDIPSVPYFTQNVLTGIKPACDLIDRDLEITQNPTIVFHNRKQYATCPEVFVQENSSKAKSEINEFIVKMHKWQRIKININHIELAQLILEDSNYASYLEQEEKNLKNFENLNRIENIKEFEDSNCIKVVCDLNNNALYFSREPIPTRSKIEEIPMGKQICVIPFQRDFLIEYN